MEKEGSVAYVSPYEEVFRELFNDMFKYAKVTKDGKSLNNEGWKEFLQGFVTGKIGNNKDKTNLKRITKKMAIGSQQKTVNMSLFLYSLNYKRLSRLTLFAKK